MTGRHGAAIQIRLVDGMHFEASGEDGVTVALDSPESHGGQGRGFRPMELLLVGLGSCTGMDVISILRKKRQDVTSYSVQVRGVSSTAIPHVYTEIDVHHVVLGNGVSEEAVGRAIELSETKYCPAWAMLRKSARLRSSYEVRPALMSG